MDRNTQLLNCIVHNKDREIIEILNTGIDPNLEGGWPVRLAARYGNHSIVRTFIRFGANPNLLSESGASTLQLAVYSGSNWSTENWNFLLPFCDSLQLADGAAVAIIFQNITALKQILATKRCDTVAPTTLTGKSVEQLAKGYKLSHLLTTQNDPTQRTTPNNSPRISRQAQNEIRNTLTPQPQSSQGNLSPSVARFFNQTSNQSSLTSPRISIMTLSPQAERILL